MRGLAVSREGVNMEPTLPISEHSPLHIHTHSPKITSMCYREKERRGKEGKKDRPKRTGQKKKFCALSKERARQRK